MENQVNYNKDFAQLDVTSRVKLQGTVKRNVGRLYSKVKDKRQKKSILTRVKNRLQNAGKHKMRRKIKQMRKKRSFPQMPGKRNKFKQYGFIIQKDPESRPNQVIKF